MSKAGFCSICNYETEREGDVKPYLLDWMDKYAIYSKDNEVFSLMCKPCWEEQYNMDNLIYKNIDDCIKTLTWDKPLPKDHNNDKVPSIIVNNIYTTNNITSNLIPTFNTSNLIPTTNNNINTNNNTTNNNTTNNITYKEYKKPVTSFHDPDGIIGSSSPDYKKVLKKMNDKIKLENEEIKLHNEKVKEQERLEKLKNKEETVIKKKKDKLTKEEIKNRLWFEKIAPLNNLNEDIKKEEETARIKEKEEI
jgi:hypothetical protein